MDKKAWLDFLYYKAGKQHSDFWLCFTYVNSAGEVRFSKWIPYLDAQSDPDFIERCNQRTQLKNEVVFDLDTGDFNKLITDLEKNNILFFAYSTNKGRARHIHTFWNNMLSYPDIYRVKFREYLLSKYGCDLAFRIDKHMIPIEFCPHWKSGAIKELIK